tara:strand:+ start:1015 stop:1950 length:936 start_codon:yes stop_codon:yes gene_type:complete
MLGESIKVAASGTVANVSCGFDCLGYSIEKPNDIVIIKASSKPKIKLSVKGNKSDKIPLIPEKNTAGKAIISMLNSLDIKKGFNIIINKGIPPGSGIGSSAASAAAALYGVNQLLDKPLTNKDLIIHGMVGEQVASGSFHADNIAPALLGGIVLVNSYDPLEIHKLPVPDNLISTIALPDFSINTKEARGLLPKKVPLKSAVKQASNLATFTISLYQNDYNLMGKAMTDFFAEPVRSELIPGFKSVYNVAMHAGAIGCGISGSGPSIFALSENKDLGKKIGDLMHKEFQKNGINSITYTSKINQNSPIILD